MVKNELIKILSNRMFLLFVILMLLFNGFYYKWALDVHSDVLQMPASRYNQAVEELSSFSDEEKLALVSGRLEEMSEQSALVPNSEDITQYDMYQEIWEELSRITEYQKQIGGIVRNADAHLGRPETGSYGALERSFMESRLEKTREIYQGLMEVEPVFYPSRGIRALLDNPITDCCCLFILLFAVFQLLTAERQSEWIILSKTTRRGRGAHGIAKALALGIVCMMITVLMTAESMFVIGSIYPFGSFLHPIQSVFSYCALRINILEYLCIYMVIKMLFFLFCTAVCYFVCCLLRKTIPIILTLAGAAGLLLYLYLTVSETSHLAPLKTMNPIAFGQAGVLLERYQCVNIFGTAVDKLIFYMILCGMLAILVFAAAVRVFAVSYEKNTTSAKRSFFDAKKRWNVGILRHECYKALISQKVLIVLMFAGAAAWVMYTPFGHFWFSASEIFYYRYSEAVMGTYTDEVEEFIAKNRETVYAEMAQPDLQEAQLITYSAMLEALTWMSEYAQYLSAHEDSYYLYNQGYTALTGGNYMVNRQNIMTSIVMYAFAVICFVLTMSIDYQHGENRLIHSGVKGRGAYLRSKLLIGMLIAAVLLGLFWLPQLVGTLRSWGTEFLSAPAYSLQHLAGVPRGISIFTYLCLKYIGKYMMLLGVMVFSYLLERKVKSSVTAIVWVCAVIEIPLVVMLLD